MPRTVLSIVVAVVLLFSTESVGATGATLAQRATLALRSSARTTTRQLALPGAVLREIEVFDEATPLRVDILAPTNAEATRAIYLLPGGGSNFKSSFFTPTGNNLASYLVARGYLVIGVTPREDALRPCDAALASTWGMAKHKTDVRSIVSKIQPVVSLPYDVLGFSFGAAVALDYASTWSDLERLLVLDIDSIDPISDPTARAAALATAAAATQLLQQGETVDTVGADFKALAIASILTPQGDSTVPRDALGLPGNFTNVGLLYFAAINAAFLPGPLTPITGLPGDWSLVQSIVAGTYLPSPTPTGDTFAFDHVTLNQVRVAALKAGSGLVPMAMIRDWSSVIGEGADYQLNWSAIQAKVVWVNTALGYGTQTHGADLIRQAGNPHVTVEVVPDYGHADVLWSRTAAVDVWPRLFR